MTVGHTLIIWGLLSIVVAIVVGMLFSAGERVSDRFQSYDDDDDDENHPHYSSFR